MNVKLRVLAVDDHESITKGIQLVLQRKGYEVLTASDGGEGLRKAREEKPDLIILDINMPVMDGYEVCRRLQADPNTANIPVLMLTVKGRIKGISRQNARRRLYRRVKERMVAFEAGAVEFISKPIGGQELVKSVRKLISISGFESPNDSAIS